jgi:hypothetical protein
MTKFYTNGKLDDPSGTGVSLNVFEDGAIALNNGKETYGYLGVEITEEEYLVWKARIANPDKETYFPGIFPGIGVVDEATRKIIVAKQAEGYKIYCEQQCEAQRINFKLAQRDAEAIGEDHEATFTSKHPEVSEDVKALLFADQRAAKVKPAKKK